jgi:hypothetical protein
VEFADKFPDKILDKTQLQIFLESLNYVSHFYKKCAHDRKILTDRLKKDPSPWTEAHTQAVRNIKAKTKNLPILHSSDDELPKIVETDASNIGWGAVLKQVKDKGKEEVIQFASGLWQATEKHYSPLGKEIKAALNAIHKFEIYLIYKKFLIKTDDAAMNKVLNKDLKNPGDSKFARGQALFNNFDFAIEHIKGSHNSIPDFLSREHLQNACLLISVQLRDGMERIIEVSDSLQWELRSTEILSQTTQVSYSNLVPEIRGRRISNVLTPIVALSNDRAIQAQNTLAEFFHDIIQIWDIRDDNHHQKYFCLNRPRLLSHWPERNPDIIFPETSINYHGYRKSWWEFVQQEDCIILVKSGSINSSMAGRPPIWISNWWKDFGLNKGAIDPDILSSFTPLSVVQDLFRQGPNDGEILRLFILNHFQWAIRSRIILQMINGSPFIARRIYTKAWDTLHYPERFSSFIEND